MKKQLFVNKMFMNKFMHSKLILKFVSYYKPSYNDNNKIQRHLTFGEGVKMFKIERGIIIKV